MDTYRTSQHPESAVLAALAAYALASGGRPDLFREMATGETTVTVDEDGSRRLTVAGELVAVVSPERLARAQALLEG